jgi:hypothetical protein
MVVLEATARLTDGLDVAAAEHGADELQVERRQRLVVLPVERASVGERPQVGDVATEQHGERLAAHRSHQRSHA